MRIPLKYPTAPLHTFQNTEGATEHNLTYWHNIRNFKDEENFEQVLRSLEDSTHGEIEQINVEAILNLAEHSPDIFDSEFQEFILNPEIEHHFRLLDKMIPEIAKAIPKMLEDIIPLEYRKSDK